MSKAEILSKKSVIKTAAQYTSEYESAVRDYTLWDKVINDLNRQVMGLRSDERYGDRSAGRQADIIAQNQGYNIDQRREAERKRSNTENAARILVTEEATRDILVVDAIESANREGTHDGTPIQYPPYTE